MTNKPVLAKDIYDKYVSEDGQVTVPDNDDEKKLLARALLGKELVSRFDYWLSYAVSIIDEELTDDGLRRQDLLSRKERYFHDRLNSLTEPQKSAVRSFIREISFGILSSTLAAFDQHNVGDFRISLRIKGQDQVTETLITPGTLNNLDEELNDWLISFSKYGDEILELIETKSGWQYKPIDFTYL